MGFRSCCSWAQLCGGMWTPPGPGIKPLAPALADAFLTSHHQGSPISFFFNALVIFHCVFVPHLYPLMDIQVISMPWLLQSGCVFYFLSVCNPITSWWLKSEFWPIGFYFLYTKCIRSFSAEWASPLISLHIKHASLHLCTMPFAPPWKLFPFSAWEIPYPSRQKITNTVGLSHDKY